MKPAETKRLYERECRARRITPQQDEFNLWHKNLRKFEIRDVDAALDSWNSCTDTDDKGESRGKWLPKPAELIPLILHEQRARETQQQGPKDRVGLTCTNLQCPYRCVTFLAKGEQVPQRECRLCHAPMTEFYREAAA